MARRAAYLAQGAEPLGVDRGLVHENLFRAVVGGDEPETLLGVEPLHLRASPARGSVRKRAIEASKKNPSVVVKHPRPREIGRPEAGERARRERRGRSSRGAPPATYLAGELRHRVSRWELRLERAARVRNGRRRLFPNATSAFFVLLARACKESESLG